jgi:hypothetical protein
MREMSNHRSSSVRNAELLAFRAHLDSIVEISCEEELPPKLARFVRMYVAGLPLDATVRYYRKIDSDGIRARVEELTKGKKRETWIGVALPKEVDRILVTKTLIREINSVEDFHHQWNVIKEWPTGSWVKVFYETPRKMDCATASLCSDPIRDSQEAELNFWSSYYDLRTAMNNPPDWRLFARPESNFSWTFLDGRYPELKHGRVLRRVLGPAGKHRRGMMQIANLENSPLVVFEFKMLPDEDFFIDYEVGEPREVERQANSKKYVYDWFVYVE